jgi:predicted RNA-binding Zn-ribbon protein involved in translation (DUF1610 family)
MEDVPPSKRVRVEDANLSISSNTATTASQDAKLDGEPTVLGSQAAAAAASADLPGLSYMRVKELQIKDVLCPAVPMTLVDNFVPKVLAVEKQVSHSKKKTFKMPVAKVSTKFACKNCGNRNQKRFAASKSQGQVTCRDCAVVVLDHSIHRGAWKRRFQGQTKDPSFHGAGTKLQCGRDACTELI